MRMCKQPGILKKIELSLHIHTQTHPLTDAYRHTHTHTERPGLLGLCVAKPKQFVVGVGFCSSSF